MEIKAKRGLPLHMLMLIGFLVGLTGGLIVNLTVGGDVAMRSFSVLKPGGRAAFIASGAQAPKPDRDDVTALRPAVPRTRAHLERIVELHRIGAVRVHPITVFGLAQAADALRVSASRHLKGKLVLKLR